MKNVPYVVGLCQREPFTATPNRLFAQFRKLRGLELRILLYICRQTIGWHRPSITIGLRALAKAIGSGSVDKTRLAVGSLQAKGLLLVSKGPRNVNIYTVAPPSGDCAPIGHGAHGSRSSYRYKSERKRRYRATPVTGWCPPTAGGPGLVRHSDAEVEALLREKGCEYGAV